MKRLLFAAVIAVCFLGVCIAGEKTELADENDRVSYSVGYQIEGDFKRQEVELNTEKLVKGVQDARSGAEPLMTRQEMHQALVDLKKKIMAEERKRRKEETEKVRKEGEDFLAGNRKKEGVVTLSSGLQYKVIKEGTGKSPKATNEVTVHYRGTFIDGTEFDSSYQRGNPATFRGDSVIAGWKEAIPMMKEGAKWQLFIPADLAYGERGAGPNIPPNAALIFEVELIQVN
ncbi:MAG: FKBP-type peptidyl-prolyl cis-trans isomerase [Candidatus Deferrimicrobiaceae bacterium]